MPTSLKRLMLAAVSLVALAQPARAVDPETFNFDYYCVTGSFTVCASVRLKSEGNILTMQVWNLQGVLGDQHTITALGLYHSGPRWTGSISSLAVNYVTAGGWTDISS